jgi:hypothetical protein
MAQSEPVLTWRHCSKNSGGGIAPAAIAGVIEGAFRSVNAFHAALRPETLLQKRR